MRLTPWERPLTTRMAPPGDKSITHRGILFSALSLGEMEIRGWLDAGDTRSSLGLVTQLGVRVREQSAERLVLDGPGYSALSEPANVVDCGNSGTTMRLGAGLVSGLPGLTVLTGDDSLRARPMNRVTGPLAQIGVEVLARGAGFAPLVVRGGPHPGGRVRMTVASAQVKSALLLAGLSAGGPVAVVQDVPTRDHTERLLAAMGAVIRQRGPEIVVEPGPVRPLVLDVPGDPSSGAPWAALAALLPGSRLTLAGVSLNPGRIGFYQALKRMGADVRFRETQTTPEPVGDIEVRPGVLTATSIAAEEVPGLIDELPLVALVATRARGTTVIAGAAELRVKESDRIRATAEGLAAMGAAIEEKPDGFVIEGPAALRGAAVDAFGDHRIAMMLAVAAAVAEGPIVLHGAESVAISYPAFFEQYARLRAGGES